MTKMKILFLAVAVMMVTNIGVKQAQAWCDPGEVFCGFVVDTTVRFGHDDVERYKVSSTGPYCTPGGSDDRWRGKAHVYRIAPQNAAVPDPLWISLDWNDDPTTSRDDLVLVVLEDCDANKCLGADPHFLEFSTQNGNRLPNNDSNGYWIIVDSRRDTTVAYTLNIYCGDFPFSVELSSFSAVRTQEGVAVNWSTASETDNDRFEVSRRELGSDEWMTVGVVAGNGTSSAQHDYSIVDRSVSSAGYYYQLAGFDANGNSQVFGSVIVESVTEVVPAVNSYELTGNYPNPFNPTTNIQFSVGETAEITLNVYDVQGRIVAELVNGVVEAGAHEIAFDATGLTSGVYFAQMRGTFGSDVMKMVLMK